MVFVGGGVSLLGLSLFLFGPCWGLYFLVKYRIDMELQALKHLLHCRLGTKHNKVLN